MCRKTNMLRINSIEGFFDMAKLLSRLTKIKKFRLAVVTNAGGPGVIVADSAGKHNFPLPEFSQETLKVVKQINPSARNPLDLIGDAKPIDYGTALRVLQKDRNIDVIYVLLTPQSMTNPERVADIVVELNNHKPLICSFLGGTAVNHPRNYLKQHDIVEFETPERGIKALSRFEDYTENKKKRRIFSLKVKGKAEIRKMLSGKKELTIQESYVLLKEFGILYPKSVFFSGKREFEKQKAKIKYPVVLKSDIASISHSTDLGLVKLNIKSKEELLGEITAMEEKMRKLKKAPRFVVQEMVKGGEEVIISSMTKEFGKVITYGLGGIFVEILRDISQKIAPLSDDDIEEMLSEVKGTQILRGARTKNKYDLEALKKTVKCLSLLALAYPEIREIEINPLIVTKKGCYAADVMAVL
jgi:acetyltransferase